MDFDKLVLVHKKGKRFYTEGIGGKKFTGKAVRYAPNGRLILSIDFKKGRENGSYKEYTEGGLLIKSCKKKDTLFYQCKEYIKREPRIRNNLNRDTDSVRVQIIDMNYDGFSYKYTLQVFNENQSWPIFINKQWVKCRDIDTSGLSFNVDKGFDYIYISGQSDKVIQLPFTKKCNCIDFIYLPNDKNNTRNNDHFRASGLNHVLLFSGQVIMEGGKIIKIVLPALSPR